MNKEFISHIWSLVCSRSTIDSETNNLTAVNIIEKLIFNLSYADSKKAQESKAKSLAFPFEFEVTSLFRKKDGQKPVAFDTRIRLVDSENKLIMVTPEQKVAVKEGIKNIRIRAKFNQFIIEKSGEHHFFVDLKGVEDSEYKTVASVPIDIVMNVSPEKSK